MNSTLKRVLLFNLNDILRPFVYGTLALVLVCVPLPFAIVLVGGGHGTDYYMRIIFSTFSLTQNELFMPCWFLFWFIFGMLMSIRRRKWARITAAIMLVLHYFGIPLMSAPVDQRFGYMWDVAPGLVIQFWCAYAVVQIIFWSSILRTEPWPFESK